MWWDADRAGVSGLVDGVSVEKGLLRVGIRIRGWAFEEASASGVSGLRFAASRAVVS